MDIEGLQVSSAVVHYIPTGDDSDKLLLTDGAIVLDENLSDYFRDKIILSQQRGLDVVIDPSQAQDVPEAVTSVIAAPARLVEASQKIASHLDKCQSGRNSPGLIAVLSGSAAGEAVVGIVKLERERGVRYVLDEVDGHQVVNLELLRNLTLTDKTKVFKTALLTCSSEGIASSVTGRVSDDQRGTSEGLPVAHFFLSIFLGCQPKIKAAKATFDFIKAANACFNTDVISPEKRGRYQVALVAAMQSQTADIVPRSFADDNLEQVDRPAFLSRIEKSGLDLDSAFPKDLSLVKVDRFKLTFASGMVLVGDVTALREKVKLPSGMGSDQPVQIHDQVNRLLTGR